MKCNFSARKSLLYPGRIRQESGRQRKEDRRRPQVHSKKWQNFRTRKPSDTESGSFSRIVFAFLLHDVPLHPKHARSSVLHRNHFQRKPSVSSSPCSASRLQRIHWTTAAALLSAGVRFPEINTSSSFYRSVLLTSDCNAVPSEGSVCVPVVGNVITSRAFFILDSLCNT